jgi:alpha-L-fucosidase 2
MKKSLMVLACTGLLTSGALGARGIYNTTPAERWEDAFVSGNGQSGVMVTGEPLDETIIFNNHAFIHASDNQYIPPDLTPVLEATRDQMLAGDLLGGWSNYCAYAKAQGMSMLESSPPFHPGFTMRIHHAEKGAVHNYRHVCNYETGEVVVKWEDKRGTWMRKTFVSRDQDLVVTLVSKPDRALLDVALNLEPALNHPQGFQHEILTSEEFLNFRCKYGTVRGKQGGYEGVTRVIADGGTVSVAANGAVEIRGANAILLLTKLDRYVDDFSIWNGQQLQQQLAGITQSYDELLAAHTAVHTEMYNRVTYEVGASRADRSLSARALIEHQYANKSEMNLALLEKVFDTSRYLFMCSSGPTHGPRLSGLFLGDWNKAGWGDDYVANANYTLQIGGGNIANLPEAMEGHFQLMERTQQDWEAGAKALFGCDGMVGPVRLNGERALFANFNEFYAHAASTGYGPWLIYSMYEHYQITGDETFLRDRVYPFLHGMAIFYEDFLSRRDAEGKVIFVPSASPENSSETMAHKTLASINATFDISACKHGLKMAIDSANTLGLQQGADEGVERWTALMKDLPEYRRESDGTLKEWSWDIAESYGHRHTTHFYMVWPAYEVNPEDADTANLVPAMKLALDKRPAPRNMKHGFGNVTLAYGYIRVKEGEKFGERLLGLFGNEHFFDSLATSHDKNLGSVYNYDFINSIQGVLIESAVLTQPGMLELLPAVPSYLPVGKLTGIKGRNRTTIQALEWDLNTRSINCTFVSDIDQELQLICRKGIDRLKCNVPVKGSGVYRTLRVKAGEPVTLLIKVGIQGSDDNRVQHGAFETETADLTVGNSASRKTAVGAGS